MGKKTTLLTGTRIESWNYGEAEREGQSIGIYDKTLGYSSALVSVGGSIEQGCSKNMIMVHRENARKYGVTVVDSGYDRLKNLLYSAIRSWYDDSLTEYHGLDDEEFVERVCSLTGLSKSEYEKLMEVNCAA